jgi:hypothetical protein
MGTFAETANYHYRLSFADQGKQTSVFHLQKTNRSVPLLFSVCSKQIGVAVFGIYIYIYIKMAAYIYL